MNTEVYDSETADVLARWWWPGQWLRIVWSVWADQKWYWQHVYPRLENRRRGWGVFVQAWLGAMLIALCLLLIGSLIAGSLGMEAVEDEFTLALLLGWVGIFAFLCFGIGLLFGATVGVPFNAVVIITVTVFAALFHIGAMSWLVYGVLCFGLGLAYGVLNMVSKGYMEWIEIILGGPFICIAVIDIVFSTALSQFLLLLSKFALAFILGGAGIYAGARWATRDLPEEIAERLKKRGKADA